MIGDPQTCVLNVPSSNFCFTSPPILIRKMSWVIIQNFQFEISDWLNRRIILPSRPRKFEIRKVGIGIKEGGKARFNALFDL